MTDTPKIPAPDTVSEGLRHIAAYVDRLFASSKPAAVLMLSTLDGQGALTVLAMGGRTHFNLIAGWEATSPREAAARNCFDRLRVTAEEKEQNGQRIFSFPMESAPQSVTDAAVAVMTEIYGVGVQDGLKFRFDEWEF